MNFAHPYVLCLLFLILPILLWYILAGRKKHPTLTIAGTEALAGVSAGWRIRLRHLLFVLRLAALSALIIAAACPQDSHSLRRDSVEGIDIILAIDISGSMLAMDLKPNRIEAAKAVAEKFINSRPNDNIGIVVFASESFTLCPLTTDHRILLNRLQEVEPGMLEDGTAIGMGLSTSIRRLQDSKAKSKVIILLTDGINNAGDIAPSMASNIAHSLGIRLYTIGVGTRGEAPYPIPSAIGTQVVNMPVDLDEPTLREIASRTGGEYFRATNNKSLSDIYGSIDKLEKTKILSESHIVYEDQFALFLWIALTAMLLEFILRNTLLRTKP